MLSVIKYEIKNVNAKDKNSRKKERHAKYANVAEMTVTSTSAVAKTGST